MNPLTQSAFAPDAASGGRAAEETLQLIAGLPAPEGLEDRVKAGLRTAPRAGRLVHWPAAPRMGRRWMHSSVVRSAAAAAIVCAVAGGGWGVHSRLHPVAAPKAVAMPPRVGAPGGFSSAGAMRTPQTLNGPVLTRPETAAPKQARAAAKVQGRAAQKSPGNGKPSASKKLRKNSSD